MNRVLVPLVKSTLVAMLAVSSFAWAAEPAAPAKADPEKGATLYMSGDPSRNITACVACHGPAGRSAITANPTLAGQHGAYIAKQLTDFKGGVTRNNPIMSTIAKGMTEEEINNVAAYLDAQKPRAGTATDQAMIDLGKKIYRGGIAERNVPACAGCHSPNGSGIPAQYPRLSGQHQDYTVAQLTAFRANGRKNSAAMTTIAKRMSEDEIKAVADYVAGLR